MSTNKRVYVFVSGGVVDNVVVPVHTNGTYCVVDWDNIESDPEREWNNFDEEEKAYIRTNYPEDFAKFFGALTK
jgi:hypothetical protein